MSKNCWIEIISYEDADDKLRKIYNRIKGPNNSIENIMLAHSLRPHTLEGHISIFKNVMHHPKNSIKKWFLELMGLYVSIINECIYCISHHYGGMAYLLDDNDYAEKIKSALETEDWTDIFDDKEAAALKYVKLLTLYPKSISESDIKSLRDKGWSDGEILEINQVISYFNYANRMVMGLGITTTDEIHVYDKWRNLAKRENQ